jgi:hypothetical protein
MADLLLYAARRRTWPIQESGPVPVLDAVACLLARAMADLLLYLGMRRDGGHGLFRFLLRFLCWRHSRTSHRLPIRAAAYLHRGYETRIQSGPP